MANILIKQGLEIAVPDFVITTDEARKVDLTSIIQTGTTASQAIMASTYFYLNDTLVRAKVDIANGATFTLNTNYEVVTAGALNELRIRRSILQSVTSDANGFISLGLPNTCEVIAVSVVGYSIFAWKRSTGYWFATVVDGSITPVRNSTFNNVTIAYME